MRNNKVQTLLIILVLALGLGYAYINSDLNINGTAQVNSANWDVHWANIAVTTGSVSGDNVVTGPTISNQTTVNYSIILDKPGDYYEFTVDAGSIDAMIDTIDSKLNGATITTLPAYLKYSVTYADGGALQPNHQLLHNTTEKYKVRIEYNADIELNQIPASNQSLSLQFTVTYRQVNENALEVEHAVTKYIVSSTTTHIGQAIPNEITQYNTASEAMAAFENRPFYLKHTVQGGIVTESYVEFVVTSAMASSNSGMTAGTYALRGLDTCDENASNTSYCKTEYYNSSTGECLSPYYATNKATLLSAFGSSNCTDYSSYLSCIVSGFFANAYVYGYVYAGDGDWYCDVDDNGVSSCG